MRVPFDVALFSFALVFGALGIATMAGWSNPPPVKEDMLFVLVCVLYVLVLLLSIRMIVDDMND